MVQGTPDIDAKQLFNGTAPMTSISQVEPIRSHSMWRCLQRQWRTPISLIRPWPSMQMQSRWIMMKILLGRNHVPFCITKWPSLQETMESMFLGDLIIDSGTYKVQRSKAEGKSPSTVISPSMQPMTVSMLPMPMLTKMKFSSTMNGGTPQRWSYHASRSNWFEWKYHCYRSGTIKLTGQSGTDFDGTATYTGGAYLYQRWKQTEIVNSMPEQGGPQAVTWR